MNRTLITFVLATFWGTGLYAQKVAFGLHFTPQFSWIDSDDEQISSSTATLFSYGLLGEYRFTEKYALGTGINIQTTGGDLSFKDTVNFNGKYRVQMIEIPLVLMMRTKQSGYMTFFAQFGGALSIRTKETVSFDVPRPASAQLDSYTTPLGASFRIGGGMEYEVFGNSAVVIGINYNHSLADNLKDADPSIGKNGSHRFRYISLTLGFLF